MDENADAKEEGEVYERRDDCVKNFLQDFNDVTFAENYDQLDVEKVVVPSFLVDDIKVVFGSPKYDEYDVEFLEQSVVCFSSRNVYFQ